MRTYSELKANATQSGIRTRRNCFPDYCSNSEFWHDDQSAFFFEEATFNDSDNTKIIRMCFSMIPNLNMRRCWFDRGEIKDETFTNEQWTTTATISKGF